MRKPVPPSQILAVTLRFLATGESYASLEYQFRISKSLLSNMIPYTSILVFRSTKLWKALKENSVYLPPAKPLLSRDQFYEDDEDLNIEHYFVCDDAFPLGMNLMKPYSKNRLTDEKRIFNYRLSRARRVSENAFGILAARFRVLHTMMCLDPRKARNVVLACCTLHNMLLSKSSQSYCPVGSIDYEDENGKVIPVSWRRDIGNTGNFISLPKFRERHPKNADDMRARCCTMAVQSACCLA